MIFHSHANKTDTDGRGFLELGSGLSSRQFQTNACFVKWRAVNFLSYFWFVLGTVYSSCFDKIYVIIVCCKVATASKEETIITSTHKLPLSSSFSVVQNKQTRRRFLASAFLPPERPRDFAFIPSVLKRVQKWWIWWIRSIGHLDHTPFPLVH